MKLKKLGAILTSLGLLGGIFSVSIGHTWDGEHCKMLLDKVFTIVSGVELSDDFEVRSKDGSRELSREFLFYYALKKGIIPAEAFFELSWKAQFEPEVARQWANDFLDKYSLDKVVLDKQCSYDYESCIVLAVKYLSEGKIERAGATMGFACLKFPDKQDMACASAFYLLRECYVLTRKQWCIDTALWALKMACEKNPKICEKVCQ